MSSWWMRWLLVIVLLYFCASQPGEPCDEQVQDAHMTGSDSDADSDPGTTESDQLERLYSAMIFRLRADFVIGRLRWENAFVLHQRVRHVLQCPPHELQAVYLLRATPADLAVASTSAVIAHMAGDVPPGWIHRLVLVDVEFHGPAPATTPEVARFVKLLPNTIVRNQILLLLGLSPHCDRTKQKCLLWLNNDIVFEKRAEALLLQHGDYIRIAVPPLHQRQLCHVPTRFAARALQRGIPYKRIRRLWIYEDWESDIEGHMPDRSTFHARFEPPDDMFVSLQVRMQREAIPLRKPGFQPGTGGTEDDPLQNSDPVCVESAVVSSTGGQAFEEPQASDVLHLHLLQDHFAAFVVVSSPHENPEALLKTYYLSPLTLQVCAFGRIATISGPPDQWKSQVVSLWIGLVDQSAPLQLFVVQPAPPQNTDSVQFASYVTLAQHLTEEVSPVLITRSEGGEHLHIAIVLPSMVTSPQVITEAGLGPRCFAAQPEVWCAASHGPVVIPNDTPYRLAPGDGLVVGVFPLTQQEVQASSSNVGPQ